MQVECTPTVVYTDGPDGVRFTAGVTAFPAPIAVASTWNTDLAEQKGAAQGAEAFDKGKNGVLGPGLASGRTPLSGRTPEYFGEDALLTGLLTAATVNGLEEGNPDKPVISDLKHYVANEQELDRQTSSSNIDERTFREVYDLPFEIALARSTPESIMCSYNQINGVYACENPILNETLKGDLGYEGYVMSDFGAVHSTAASLVAGLDQELNRPRFFTPALLDAALAAGQITQAQIEAAATRVISAYIRGGLFDHPLAATPVEDASTAEHKAIARQLAEEGTVLLKNDGALPLQAAAGTHIALFGPTASSTPTNGISAASVCSMAWRFNNAGTLNCEDLVSPEAAIRERAAAVGATVTFNPGTDPASVAADAAAADVAIVFGYQRMGEFNDLPDLHLQGGGDALIGQVAAANDSTIVVSQHRKRGGDAVDRRRVGRVRGVVRRRAGRAGARRAALRRREPLGQAADVLPEVARRRADEHAGAVPRHLLGRIDDAARGIAGDPAGQLHRGSRGGLPVVRVAGHRTALRLRPRPVVHRLRVQPRAGHPEVDRRCEGDPHPVPAHQYR